MARLMPDEPNLVCAFSSRSSGNMSLSYADTSLSLSHRKDFLAGLGIDYRDLICAKQIHSNSVKYVLESDRGKGAFFFETAIDGTDALITDKKDLPLAIFTADCLPVFLFDPATPAIGQVHAGWRSSKENITANTLRQMIETFGTDPADVRVGFGPVIRECCYEVDREFRENFPEDVRERDCRYYLDLCAVNKRQLMDLGVKPQNVTSADICTSCKNEEFFSYRKEKDSSGRMICVMMLK